MTAPSHPGIQWPLPPKRWPLHANEVHVWAVALDQPPEALATLGLTLSPEERARAARFHFERDQRRFAAARGSLRILLGKYLDIAPARVQFNYSPQGKPAVDQPLHFNLSHSGGLALIAVTRIGDVGVDVEHIRPVKDDERIADRFFAAGESAAFKALPAAEKPAAFFNLWTRKEAWLKATGQGLSDSLDEVEVSFLSGDIPRFIRLPGEAGPPGEWFLFPLSPAPGYAGAVTVRVLTAEIRTWQFHQNGF